MSEKTAMQLERNDPRILELKRRQFYEEIQPFVNMKVKIYSVCTKTMLLIDYERNIQHSYALSEKQKDALSLIDENIEFIRRKIFGDIK